LIITNQSTINNQDLSYDNLQIYSSAEFIQSKINITGELYSTGSNITLSSCSLNINNLTLNSIIITLDINTTINVTNCLSLKNVSILIDLKNEDINTTKKLYLLKYVNQLKISQ
jgi:hypothetical protein